MLGWPQTKSPERPQNPPEVGQVQPTPDHPTRSQGDDAESCKEPEGGGKNAGGENPFDPATTDKQLRPQVNNKAPKSKAKPKAKGKAKATMVQHQVKETRLLEPRLHPTNAGTTPTAQASVNVRLVKPAGESRFRKACAWKKETLKAKEMPKAKKEKAKVLRAKGRKKERRRSRTLNPRPQPVKPGLVTSSFDKGRCSGQAKG